MFNLNLTQCHDLHASAFEKFGRILRHNGTEDLRAAIWWSGHGPWRIHFPFADDGEIALMAPSQDGSLLPAAASSLEIASLKITMAWFVGHWREKDTLGASMAGLSDDAFCVIMRPTAAIILFSGDRNFYAPAPGVSAHQIIADGPVLEREFPRLFAIKE